MPFLWKCYIWVVVRVVGYIVCAFRADNLSENDLREVSAFKEIVLNYMKMERLLAI